MSGMDPAGGAVSDAPTPTPLTRAGMERRYRDNLLTLRSRAPGLYEALRSHVPRSVAIRFEDGCVDLVSVAKDVRVYGGDAAGLARRQVESYRGRPRHGSLRTVTTAVLDEKSNAHTSCANAAVRALLSEPADEVERLPASVDYMLVLGLGLGYHIEELLGTTEIRHLCMVESQPDVIYASLHTLDWAALMARFSRPGHSLELVFEADPEAITRAIGAHLDRIGPYNAVKPFVYEHASSATLTTVKEAFFDRVLPGKTNHVGYFDDERVGLAHTLRNYRNEVPVLQDHVLLSGRRVDVPAFVVANGPSLDKAIGVLRAQRERAIVFSCGTALGSLTKAGIKPDFHVEMERSRPVVEWIQSATAESDRDGVPLLALNTVHPEVFGLFERSAMAMKANDAGTALLSRYFAQGSNVVNFAHCNPTVANSALAFAAAFGFTEVYLIGLDLGFSPEGKHHSSFSLHYDVAEERQEELGVYQRDADGNLKAPGNLGGEVVTTRVWKSAAQAVQRVIAGTPGLRCYNVGHGMRIDGADPVQPWEVKLATPDFDRSAFVDRTLDGYFGRRRLEPANPEVARRVFDRAGRILREMRDIARPAVKTRHEAWSALERMRVRLTEAAADPKDRHAVALVQGSVSYFSTVLAQALVRFEDETRCIELYWTCLQSFLDFLEWAEELTRANPLALDNRTRDLAAKLQDSNAPPARENAPLPS